MNKPCSSPARQSGFTMVELMVAIALSLILLTGVIQIFVSSKTAYSTQDALSRLQESGRFAVEFLAHDLRMADFWACGSGQSLRPSNNLRPGGTGYVDFSDAITGTEGGGTVSDSVTIRYADDTSSHKVEWHNQKSATIHVDDATGLTQGDIVLVCDPRSGAGDIFQITNNPADKGAIGNVVHNTGKGVVEPGNESPTSNCPTPGQGSTHCLANKYDAGALVLRTVSKSYSIIDTGRTDSGGAAVYALAENGSELVENVSNMQVLYGLDSDAPDYASIDKPTRYVTATDVPVGEWWRVLSVRIALLVQSQEQVRTQTDNSTTYSLLGVTVGPFNDRRLRQVFTTTVKIRNRGIK